MKRVEMTVIFQIDVHDDNVDVNDLSLEFEFNKSAMVVYLASDSNVVVNADVNSYETTAVEVMEEP